jgi:hypothetical protein
MTPHTFRIRFLLSDRTRLLFDEAEHPVVTEDEVSVVLRSRDLPTPIRDADELLLLGTGYRSFDTAEQAGTAWLARLQLALARVNVGADFGLLAKPGGFFTTAGLQWMREHFGVARDDQAPVLQERLGLMVYPSQPTPYVASAGNASLQVGVAPWRLRNAIEAASTCDPSSLDTVAYHLFAASYFQHAPEARLLELMMAVEAMLRPQPRSPSVQAHVETLLAMTRTSNLDPTEKRSLLTSLGLLRHESFNQAGRRLAQTLGARLYAHRTPDTFFSHCYTVRSQLVHGLTPRPTAQEVDVLAAQLERYVADLLSGPLLHDASIDTAPS